MRAEAIVTFAISMIVLGAGLVAYAHANFASKTVVERMDERIYEIHSKVVGEKNGKEETHRIPE